MAVRVGVVVLLLVLLSYGGSKAYPLLAGPELIIESPAQNAKLPDGLVHIRGRVKHTETLTLNGGPLLIDETGAFLRELLLPPGSAILSLTATDRFGRSVTKRQAVFILENVMSEAN